MAAQSTPAAEASRSARRTPPVNRAVLAVLRSRWHGLLPGLCALSFHGRRTGVEVTLPVQYAREDHLVVICAGRASGKRWWRNFAQPRPATLLLDGTRHTGGGHLVTADHPDRQAAERIYHQHHPRVSAARSDPLVVITLRAVPQGQGQPCACSARIAREGRILPGAPSGNDRPAPTTPAC